jgi:ubiquinone/menaquinone biosynthesis C-methylase UbiE
MNVLSTVAPWDLVAEGYSQTTMLLFEGYVETALELVELHPDHNIIDVACGPGTLALAAADKVASVKAVDFSKNMLSMLEKAMAERGVTNIEPHHGDGQKLPYGDNCFDTAFSMFGLMFFPEREKGYSEIYRTLVPGGHVCISSWAPVDRSPMMQLVFGALRAINPEMPTQKTDPQSLENPDILKSELATTGFRRIKVHGMTISAEIASAESFWEGVVKGSAPVMMMKDAMSEDIWREKSKLAIAYIEEAAGSFPILLSADAWLGVGVK